MTDYESLYLLGTPLNRKYYYLEVSSENYIDRVSAGHLSSGKLLPKIPVRLVLLQGMELADFMWSTLSSIIVISNKLEEMFEVKQVTGWSTYPMEIHNNKDETLTCYSGLATFGKAGKYDLSRVKVIKKPPITPKGLPYENLKGVYFENDFWDGSDFCVIEKSGMIVVTEEVVNIFQKCDVQNVSFEKFPDAEISALIYKVRGIWPLIEKNT